MKLYWGPHTCAIGIHVLLEEVGARYGTEKLDVMGGETGREPFRSVNPKGKVPVLVLDDGTVLTEFGAIATWIARSFPDARLIPEDAAAQVRVLEVMDYVVGTLHGQAFGRIFLPARFEPQDVVHQATGLGTGSVKAQGRRMVDECLGILDRQIGAGPYVAGERLSIADAALFYALRWAPQQDIPLPPNLEAHLARMRARPAVAAVMRAEGEPGVPPA